MPVTAAPTSPGFTASYAAGKVKVAIRTSNPWTHSQAVCFFFTIPGPAGNNKGGSAGCYGPKVNNGNVGSDIPIGLAHPSLHLTVITVPVRKLRVAPYRIVKPSYFLIATWSHGNGDRFDDRCPAAPPIHLNDRAFVKLDVKPPA